MTEDPGGNEQNGSLEQRLLGIRDHLAATAELPVQATASTYLGEAEAVATDAVVAIRDDHLDVAITRTEQVAALLGHVDETGSDDADEHVQAATQLAETVLEADRTAERE